MSRMANGGMDKAGDFQKTVGKMIKIMRIKNKIEIKL